MSNLISITLRSINLNFYDTDCCGSFVFVIELFSDLGRNFVNQLCFYNNYAI